MICKNIIELENEIKKRINNALSTEVKDVVLDVVYKNTLKVYDRQPSHLYERRGDIDGLADPSNLVWKQDNGRLVVENITKTNPFLNGYNTSLTFPYNSFTQRGYSKHMDKDYLAPIIEYNKGYDYGSPEAVPFMHNSYEELISYGLHIKAFKQGLKRQGLEVK